jgi:hypothetical protein
VRRLPEGRRGWGRLGFAALVLLLLVGCSSDEVNQPGAAADPATSFTEASAFLPFDPSAESALWEKKRPAAAPPARTAHAMTYDQGRGAIVLYSGILSTETLPDTWLYDGAWTPGPPGFQGLVPSSPLKKAALSP